MNNTKLDFYVTNQLNALFVGKHGCGKTVQIVDCFNRSKLKWVYFSASTMDPWVDFVGIPKEKVVEGKSYIELIKPKCFADDTVEAIFFDEFNRAPKKVRNAVMELIQFKSINGQKLNNLKIVWAAINPHTEEDTYDVEKLDPAQEDRFHVRIEVPFKPDASYFKSKYGEVGSNAVGWWTELPTKLQELVSPRRLDYAVDIFLKKGDLRDVLSDGVGVQKLVQELNSGSYVKRLAKLVKENIPADIQAAMAEENFYSSTIGTIIEDEDYIKVLASYIPKEKLITQLTGDAEFVKKFAKAVDDPTPFMEVLSTINTKNRSGDSFKELEKWKVKTKFYEKERNLNPITNAISGNGPWVQQLASATALATQTPHKIKIFDLLNDKAKVNVLTNKDFEQWIKIFEDLTKSLQVSTLRNKCGLMINSICKIMCAEYGARFKNGAVPSSFPRTLADIVASKNTFGSSYTFWATPPNYNSANALAQQLLNQVSGNRSLPKANLIPDTEH